MNKEAILDVANLIEQNEHLYDQSCWGDIHHKDSMHAARHGGYHAYLTVGPDCGTPGCIAAWSQYS